MTVRIIELADDNGLRKWYAYHAHIVYHGDPDSVDFDPDDNSTVEVMAVLPHSSHLASMRSAKQMGLEEGAVIPARAQVIDIVCPDPKCGSITTYFATGDPEARVVHNRYNQDVTDDNREMRLAFDFDQEEHRMQLISEIKPFVANAGARAALGLHPSIGHEHLDVMVDGQKRTIVSQDHAEHKALIEQAQSVKA